MFSPHWQRIWYRIAVSLLSRIISARVLFISGSFKLQSYESFVYNGWFWIFVIDKKSQQFLNNVAIPLLVLGWKAHVQMAYRNVNEISTIMTYRRIETWHNCTPEHLIWRGWDKRVPTIIFMFIFVYIWQA